MRPKSMDSRPNPCPKSVSHKKDKFSFYEEPRFLNLNINLLQSTEASSKKILQKNTTTDNLWDQFLSKTPDSSNKKQTNIYFHKNKSNILEAKPIKSSAKKAIALSEFEKNISKISLKYDDPKIELLKKTIFSHYSKNSDYHSVEFKNNFRTENKQEYIPYDTHKNPSEFSHLLLEYKLGKYDSGNDKVDKNQDFNKKFEKKINLGKKPEFIRDLQQPTFYMFNKFGAHV